MAANCEACSAPLTPNTKFCKGCGAHVVAATLAAPDEPTQQTIPDSSLTYCPVCSGQNAVAARFCRHCGNAMDSAIAVTTWSFSPPDRDSANDETKPLFNQLAVSLFLVSVALTGIAGAAWHYRSEWLGIDDGATRVIAVATSLGPKLTRAATKDEQVQRFVVAEANVRNRATAQGSNIVSKIPRGSLVSGFIQIGEDGVSQWLNLDNGVGFVGAINLSTFAPPKLANSFGDLEWSVEVDTDLLAAPASGSAVAKRV